MAHLVFADLSAKQAGTQPNAEKPKSLSQIHFGKQFFANAPTEKTNFGLKNLRIQ